MDFRLQMSDPAKSDLVGLDRICQFGNEIKMVLFSRSLQFLKRGINNSFRPKLVGRPRFMGGGGGHGHGHTGKNTTLYKKVYT